MLLEFVQQGGCSRSEESVLKWFLMVALGWLGAGAAQAADIQVLTAGAYKSVLTAAAPAFERKTGHRLVIRNDTAGALAKRIRGGEAFDLAVLTPAVIDELERAALLVPGALPLARVGIGVVVKRGAAMPDIASVDALKAAIHGAKKLAYLDPAVGGSSGIYMAQLFQRWGIADEVARKAVLVPGGSVAERVANGEADLGIHQISEIVSVEGAQLVGPLPAEIQNHTVYAAALSTHSAEPQAAQALARYLASDAAREIAQRRGMEAPAPVAAHSH